MPFQANSKMLTQNESIGEGSFMIVSPHRSKSNMSRSQPASEDTPILDHVIQKMLEEHRFTGGLRGTPTSKHFGCLTELQTVDSNVSLLGHSLWEECSTYISSGSGGPCAEG